MPKLQDRIESVDKAIKGAELTLEWLKSARACAIHYEVFAATKTRRAYLEQLYKNSIDLAMDMAVGTLITIPLCAADNRHLQLLCDMNFGYLEKNLGLKVGNNPEKR